MSFSCDHSSVGFVQLGHAEWARTIAYLRLKCYMRHAFWGQSFDDIQLKSRDAHSRRSQMVKLVGHTGGNELTSFRSTAIT